MLLATISTVCGTNTVFDTLYSTGIDTLLSHSSRLRNSYTNIDLSKEISTFKSSADLISFASGVQTRKLGGEGSYQTVSIRGIKADNIRIFLNGTPVNSAMGGAVDLSLIDPSIIKTVEIYRGFIPAKFGGNGLGGVVNIITQNSTKYSKKVVISNTLSSFHTVKQRISFWTIPSYLFDVFGYITYGNSKNNFPYLDRNNTPYNSNDDEVKQLKNSNYDMFSSEIRPVFYLQNGRNITVSIREFNKNYEIPATEGHENKTAKEKMKNFSSTIKIEKTNNYTDYFNVSYTANYRHITNYIFWTGMDDFGAAHGMLKSDQWAELKYSENIANLIITGLWNPFSMLSINFTSMANGDFFHPATVVSNNIYGDYECEREKFVASTDITFTKNIFSGTAGYSLSISRDATSGGKDNYTNIVQKKNSTFKHTDSYRVALSLSPFGNNKSMYFTAGRYIQQPSLREKYGAKGGQLPNPNLKDEILYSIDCGFDFSTKAMNLSLRGFLNRDSNGIVLISDGKMSKAVNINKSLIYGIESDIEVGLFKLLNIKNSFTLQKSINKHPGYDGNLLPLESPVAENLYLKIKPTKGLYFSWGIEYKSRYFEDPANLYAVPSDKSKNGIGTQSISVGFSYKSVEGKISLANLPLAIFSKDSYRTYAFEHTSGTGDNGYYWFVYPGVLWNISINYSF